jgi:hypothetical protein
VVFICIPSLFRLFRRCGERCFFVRCKHEGRGQIVTEGEVPQKTRFHLNQIVAHRQSMTIKQDRRESRHDHDDSRGKGKRSSRNPHAQVQTQNTVKSYKSIHLSGAVLRLVYAFRAVPRDGMWNTERGMREGVLE